MALCCCIPLAGQDYQQIPEGIKATINSVDVELQFYTPSIVRILKSPNGWKYTKERLSPSLESPAVERLRWEEPCCVSMSRTQEKSFLTARISAGSAKKRPRS